MRANKIQAFQERLLSRRVVSVHYEELIWECRTSTRCECGQVDDNRLLSRNGTLELITNNGSELVRVKHNTWIIDQSQNSIPKLYSAWIELLAAYCNMNLTYESDRLAAISGLAVHYAQPQLGTYIAGIWMGSLPLGLGYAIVGNIYDSPPESPSNAPSWSWASNTFHSGIGLSSAFGTNPNPCPDFATIAVKYQLKSENPYNWVDSAILSIRARCLSCFIRDSLYYDRHFDLYRFGDETAIELDRKIKEKFLTRRADGHHISSFMKKIISSDLPATEPLTSSVSPDPGSKVISMSEVLLLHLGSDVGIVLSPVPKPNSERDTYRRIGIANLKRDTSWKRHSFIKEIDLI